LHHAYRSFNNPLATAWAAIAPGVPIAIDTPDDADTLPPECLRVFWSSYGDPTGQGNERSAVIDVAVRVPPIGNQPNPMLALARAKAVDKALGLDDTGGLGGAGCGRLGRFDWTVSPIAYLNDMDILPDHGWIAIPTGSPGLFHVARTLRLLYRI
jgi:hypothetical protein